MTPSGKVRVIVRSRNVPVGTTLLERRSYSHSGMWIGSEPKQVILYESRFDPEHLRAIEKGRKLSCDLGLGLEVVDLSKSGLFRRAALGFLAGNSPVTIVPNAGIGGISLPASAEPANLSSNP